MEPIRQTPVETPAGTYVVQWFWDETAPAEPPYDHACGLLKKGGPRTIDIREDCGGQIGCGRGLDASPDWAGLAGRQAALRSVWSALACRRHSAWDPTDAVSGAALVRYLTLKGFAGATVIDDDFHAVEASADRAEHVHGVAWVSADFTDPASAVAGWLADWRAWRDGDVFGWVAYTPGGEEIESSWGYYGFSSSEQQYTFECAESFIHAHAQEQVEKANLVGAGIIGPI
jgi:hypothetical protein